MFGFHEKRKLRGIIYSKGVIALIGVAVIFMSFVVWNSYIKERDTRIRKNEQWAEFEELSQREKELESEILRLQSARGIEAEVRDKYDVRLPGEELIVIIEFDEEDGPPLPTENTTFWSRFLDLFKRD